MLLIYICIKIYDSSGHYSFFVVHVALSLILFIMTLFCIVWRIINPYYPVEAKQLERNVQLAVYYSMYMLMLVIVISGYLSLKYPVNLLIFTIKPIYGYSVVSNYIIDSLSIDPVLLVANIIALLHELLVYLLIFLIVIHIFMVVVWMFKRNVNYLKKMF